jgi:hypothetical protein
MLVAPVLMGCAGQRVPYLMADVPDDIRSTPAAAFPNINLAPDREPRTRSADELRELEQDLEEARENRIREAEEAIERSGRSS